jgi:endonuclease YncB( thermonuclease family)
LIVLVCLSAAAIGQKAPPSKPFEPFDGDSFRVQLPDSRLETFRLYFVDTTESRSRGKRSDEQAAYFGLTRAQAIELGRQAKTFTASVLAQPFTIYTRWRSVFRTNSLLCDRHNLRRS